MICSICGEQINTKTKYSHLCNKCEKEFTKLGNKQLAKKIDDFLPFWEKEENFYNEILKILNNNNKKYIAGMIDFLKDYHGSEEIINELRSKL